MSFSIAKKTDGEGPPLTAKKGQLFTDGNSLYFLDNSGNIKRIKPKSDNDSIIKELIASKYPLSEISSADDPLYSPGATFNYAKNLRNPSFPLHRVGGTAIRDIIFPADNVSRSLFVPGTNTRKYANKVQMVNVQIDVRSASISGYAIIDADTASDFFVIEGDYTDVFLNGTVFEVANSTSNDGTYTVSTAILNSDGDTQINITGSVPSNTADGTLGWGRSDRVLSSVVFYDAAEASRAIVRCGIEPEDLVGTARMRTITQHWVPVHSYLSDGSAVIKFLANLGQDPAIRVIMYAVLVT